MAEVFLAEVLGPEGFKKKLVVKRILPGLAENPEFVEMFRNEARIAAQLTHPNLAQIFELGKMGTAPFLSMEYIDGPNLRTVAASAAKFGKLLDVQVVCKIIALACEGLAHAHELAGETGPLKLIHRDISPENIMVSSSGAVKVVDFGIAKASTSASMTQAGNVRGKLAYMAPEQVAGLVELDHRADLYSLCVVMYELLSGNRKPFNTVKQYELMQAILNEAPIPLSQVSPHLPRALVAIVEKGMAKSRDDRYPTCRELAADLERLLVAQGAWVSGSTIAAAIQAVMVPTPGVAVHPTPPQGHSTDLKPITGEIEIDLEFDAAPLAPAPAAKVPQDAAAPKHLAPPIEAAPPAPAAEAAPLAMAAPLARPEPAPKPKAAAKPQRKKPPPVPIAAEPAREAEYPEQTEQTEKTGEVAVDPALFDAPKKPQPLPSKAAASASTGDARKGPPWQLIGIGALVVLALGGALFGLSGSPDASPSALTAMVPEKRGPPPPAMRPPPPTPAPTAPAPAPAPEPVVAAVAAAEPELMPAGLTDSEPTHLKIESTPSCDAVVDGVIHGPTPVEVKGLTPGEHSLTLRCKGIGLERTLKIEVLPGKETTFSRTTFEPGRLLVRAEPFANVIVDGKSFGQTPLAIPLYEGGHQVELIYDGARMKERRTRSATVKSNADTVISEVFER